MVSPQSLHLSLFTMQSYKSKRVDKQFHRLPRCSFVNAYQCNTFYLTHKFIDSTVKIVSNTFIAHFLEWGIFSVMTLKIDHQYKQNHKDFFCAYSKYSTFGTFFIQVDAPFETIRYCGFEW